MNASPLFRWLLVFIGLSVWSGAQAEAQPPVMITPELMSIEVTHQGKKVTIQRHQNPDNVVIADYAKTSRACPPFCIKPIRIAPGVETLGELEMLDYLQRAETDDSIVVVDSRTPDWVIRGTIPGSINLPWTELDFQHGANSLSISVILEDQFGAILNDEIWDFSSAKTVVLFCNGMWCGQSPRNIATLTKLGYPAHKIKWYRGGMQNWTNLGLTIVKP